MGSELAAAPQPLQVLHVSEQEEDVFAFRMGLEQPGSTEGKKKKTATVERPAAPGKMTLGISVRGQREVSHSRINHSSGREDLIERLGLSPHRRRPPLWRGGQSAATPGL